MLSCNFRPWMKWQKYDIFLMIQIIDLQRVKHGRLKGPKIENETSKTIVLLSFRPWTKIIGRHEQVYIVVLPDWKLYNQSHIDIDRVYYCRKFSNRCALLYWLWLNCGTKIFHYTRKQLATHFHSFFGTLCLIKIVSNPLWSRIKVLATSPLLT